MPSLTESLKKRISQFPEKPAVMFRHIVEHVIRPFLGLMQHNLYGSSKVRFLGCVIPPSGRLWQGASSRNPGIENESYRTHETEHAFT